MSKIEVNTVDVASGSTLTLGSAGKTVAIASGASTSGMGRTGTVDWQTSSIKTATFTAVSGEGYFCNTAGGSFEVDLPAGSAGAIVSVQDYNNTFDSNSVTIDPNGSEKINGGSAGGIITLSAQGQGVTLVYIDGTVGWRSVQENEFDTSGANPSYVTASGGNTVTTSGNYKIHVFTSPGNFVVSCAGNADGSTFVDYLVVAGGGGTPGGHYNNTPAGGAGAGGFRASAKTFSIGCQPAKPLVCGVSSITTPATTYPIVVGAGGSAGSQGPGNSGSNGSNSSAFSITSTGGGKGGHNGGSIGPGGNGGSGGGGGQPFNAGSGNTPPVSPPQGNPGGVGVGHPSNPSPGSDNTGLGAGGGALTLGLNGGGVGNPTGGGGAGGTGAGFASGTWGSTGQVVSCVQYYAGGGGGGVYTPNPSPNPGGPGGLGGGGAGGSPANPGPHGGGIQGQAGTANTGGGASSFGGAPSPSTNFAGNAGGSGIVVIRYKYQ